MMLKKEENDLLTQTSPGTPCGDLMRRYWQPVALSDELPADGSPLAIRLLSENLVLFRDGQGRLGLLGRACSHRTADLAFGEVEEQGLRCFYHGWLYDVEGHCLDQPLEPPESKFHETIQHRAYPCLERAGIIFAYLGPAEAPVLPAYEFFGVPEPQRRATKYLLECNYLQAVEGNVDPLQSLMHRELFSGATSGPVRFPGDMALVVEAEATGFGLHLRAARGHERGGTKLEIRDFMLPALCATSGVGIDGYTVHWHVPIDDTHHWRYVIAFNRDRPLTDDEARSNGVERVENFRLVADLTDRDTPVGFLAYATAIAEGQGSIYDRTQEHLGPTDEGVIGLRNVVHKAIQDVQEGADPPHVIRDAGSNQWGHIAGQEVDLPKGADWRSWSAGTGTPSVAARSRTRRRPPS